MLAAVDDNGIEDIVTETHGSQYVSGRSTSWIKSPVCRSCELAIVGWRPPAGPASSGRVGALLLAGHRADGKLVLVGQVGSGFSDVERRRLHALLAKLPRNHPPLYDSPNIDGVHWVTPRYVGEVAFREYIPGRGLRHASWKGLRGTTIDGVGMPHLDVESQ